MQSINNKLAELVLLLNSNLKHINVSCFTEHWLKEDYLKVIKIDQYKLVILAERIMINVDPVYIYIYKKTIVFTKDYNVFRVLVWKRIFW